MQRGMAYGVKINHFAETDSKWTLVLELVNKNIEIVIITASLCLIRKVEMRKIHKMPKSVPKEENKMPVQIQLMGIKAN